MYGKKSFSIDFYKNFPFFCPPLFANTNANLSVLFSEVSEISSAYKVKGSKTAAEITSALLVAANEGGVYNVSEEFTTTADFVEGAGKVYPAGTNVVVADAGGGSYKFDVLSGFVDVSALSETASSDTR